MQTPEPVRRTSEIEDFTNLYFIHVMANWLTPRLALLHVKPNAVSIAGMLFGISAGIAYFHYAQPLFTIAGFVLMIAWHVMDGTDGQLARLTRSQSESGKVLDGICDYVTFIAVYTGLALQLGRHHGGWVWVVVIAAGASHAVQSAAYEALRQEYDVWGWGRISKQPAGPQARSGGAPSAVWLARLSGPLHRLYERLQSLATGFSTDFHQKMDRAVFLHPERLAELRSQYRNIFAPSVRRWAILSANTRTIGIFLCALLQLPLGYFIFEIVGFSLILAGLIRQQRARQASFLVSLSMGAAEDGD